MKIFYNPKTLKIMGMSDGEISLELPYVETDEDYHSTGNLAIEIVEGEAILKVVNGFMKDSVYNQE